MLKNYVIGLVLGFLMMAGSVSGAATTNVSSCQVIITPGEYVLNTSITNSSAPTCISIVVSNVNFDGQGYTIDGVDNSSAYGVYVYEEFTNFTNVVVKNLKVTDWGTGIKFDKVENSAIENNTASSNINVGIRLHLDSNFNNVTYNNASNNQYGIYIDDSSNNNTLTDNTASNNNYGIYLNSSGNNTFTNNTANSNNDTGIYLENSSSNAIYNNLFNNTNNFDLSSSNIWNTTKTAGTNIVAGPYFGGNFWAYPNGTGFSETCADADSDGICDSSYTLETGNVDYLPLTYDTTPPSLKCGAWYTRNATISPLTSPGEYDDLTIYVGDFNEAVNYELRIKNQTGVVYSFSGSNALSLSHMWFGNDSGNQNVSDGVYTVELFANDPAGNNITQILGYVTVDNTLPGIAGNVSISPNPFNNSDINTTRISVNFTEPVSWDIRVFNQAGKLIGISLISSLTTTVTGADGLELDWDKYGSLSLFQTINQTSIPMGSAISIQDSCNSTPSGGGGGSAGTLQSLLPEGNYTLTIEITDIAGNKFNTSEIIEVEGYPDTDGDGVVDVLDECPDTPSGTPVDTAGCSTEFFHMDDEDGDGMDDNWESTFFCMDPTNGMEKDIDYDTDTFTNIDEFYGFSDPCDAGSIPMGDIGPPPVFDMSWSGKTNTNITFYEGNVTIYVLNETDNNTMAVNGILNDARLCNDSFGAYFDYHFEAEIVNASNQSQKIGGIGGRITNLTNKTSPISESNGVIVASPMGGGAKLMFTPYGSMMGAEPSFSGNITINVAGIPSAMSGYPCTNLSDFNITGGNLTGYTSVMKDFGFDFIKMGFVFGGGMGFAEGLDLSEMETRFGENITFGDGITFLGFPMMPPYARVPNGSTIGNMSYFGRMTGGDWGVFDGDFLGDGAIFDPFVTMFKGSRVEGNVTIGQNTTIGNFTEIRNFTTIGALVQFDPFVMVKEYVKILAGAKIRANATIGKYVEIGNNSIVGRFVNISQNATLGKSVRLYDNASVGESVVIENFAKIYNNTVLGKDVLVGQYARIYKGAKVWDGSIVGNKSTVGQNSEIYDGKLYSYVDVGPNVTLNKTTAENSTINYTINAANFSDDDVLINHTVINASGYISNKPGANGSIHLTEENVRVNFTNLNELRDLSSNITIHDLIRDANTGIFNVTIVGGKMNITRDGDTTTDLNAGAEFFTVFNDTDMGVDVGMNFTDDSDANMGVAVITINPGGVALPDKATGTNSSVIG